MKAPGLLVQTKKNQANRTKKIKILNESVEAKIGILSSKDFLRSGKGGWGPCRPPQVLIFVPAYISHILMSKMLPRNSAIWRTRQICNWTKFLRYSQRFCQGTQIRIMFLFLVFRAIVRVFQDFYQNLQHILYTSPGFHFPSMSIRLTTMLRIPNRGKKTLKTTKNTFGKKCATKTYCIQPNSNCSIWWQ